MLPIIRGASLGVIFSLLACGGGQKAVRGNSPVDGDSVSSSASIHQARKGGEKVAEFDLNRDNKPDVWAYTVPAKGSDGQEFDRLVRKELDINWDGKVDIRRAYDEKEMVEKEALDLDFDGKIDQWNYYEKSVLVRKEQDLDYNGKTDLWIFYEKGKVVRKERDKNGDGKVDYWEYWEADQVDRIGEDLDSDGTVDRWTKNPNSRE